MVYRAKKDKNFTVMSNYHLRDMRLSLKAKGLLSQMLSLPDDWTYTAKGLAAINKESYHVIRGVIGELEDMGYIIRRRKREKSGVWTIMEYDIFETPQLPDETEAEEAFAEPDARPEAEEPDRVPAKTDEPAHEAESAALDVETLNRYRNEIKENVDYDILVSSYHADPEILSGYVEMMAEVCAGNESISVRGRKVPPEEVRNRFLSLDFTHMQYVMDSLQDMWREIRNIRAYTLASLYNAPKTIDQYYASRVSSDRWKAGQEEDE